MPVVNKKANNFAADTDPAKARGRPIVVADTVTNAADDSALSTYLLAMLPSCAILDALTTFKADTWGFATLAIGTLTDTDALVSVARDAAIQPVTRNGAIHGQPLWQALGLSADPGGEIGLYAHGLVAPTGAGTMNFEIHYRHR